MQSVFRSLLAAFQRGLCGCRFLICSIQFRAGIGKLLAERFHFRLLDIQSLQAGVELLLIVMKLIELLFQRIDHLVVPLGNPVNQVHFCQNIVKIAGADQRGEHTVIAVDVSGADARLKRIQPVIESRLLVCDIGFKLCDLFGFLFNLQIDILELCVNQEHLAVNQVDFFLQSSLILFSL